MADGSQAGAPKNDAAPAAISWGAWARTVLPRYMLAFVIGTMGSLLFVYLHLPLPWYLGALTFCLVASVAHVPIARPKSIAGPVRSVLGVAVGSAFTPAILERAGGMTGSLAVLVPFMAIIIMTSLVFYERVAGFDRPTAFFSAVPGGLADMTAMAEEAGANQRAVILVQATRIVMIVFIVPLYLKMHDGIAPASVFATRVRIADMTLIDTAVLVSMALGGWLTARKLGLAGAPIVGPMLLSGLVHSLGLTTARVPLEALVFSQISVGVLLGSQFRGLTMREFTHTIVWGVLNAAVLLGVTAVVVNLVARLTGFEQVSILLAFAPGGQTELNLLAYILGLDVAYVALHHLMRLAIVIFGAQLVFRTQKRNWRKA